MTQWLNRSTRSACLFMRHACLTGVLLAALAGCNDGGGGQKPTQSTFGDSNPTTDNSTKPADDSKVAEEAVVAVVTKVPDTDPGSPPHVDTPQARDECDDTLDELWERSDKTNFGEVLQRFEQCSEKRAATNKAAGVDGPTPDHESKPFEDPFGLEPAIDMKHAHDDLPMPSGRFLETAPDTIEGTTFWSSPAYEYNLGNLVAVTSEDSVAFTNGSTLITPVHGWLRYPKDAMGLLSSKTYPVIVFLHGNHANTDPSYRGYDYLAEHMATHGYVVLSLDANAINPGDSSSQSRAQLVLGTLDRLRQVNEQGHINPDGTPGALNGLKGKLDFSRIGIMGHSRGGQAISNAILFNTTRRGTTLQDLIAAVAASRKNFTSYPDLTAAINASGSVDEAKLADAIKKYNIFFAAGSGNADKPAPYDFKGAFMLAPTDFGGNSGLNHVPLAVLLPSCDGDVYNLQGAMSYDHSRFGPDDDIAPRYQIMVNGANHNDYNTIWTGDDFRGSGPNYCTRGRADNIRLSDEDQRRTGLFIINSFMRYHVGGEKIFASWWNGMAHVPEAACPRGIGPCDERIVLTAQKDASRRKLIQRFEPADSLEQNLLGGKTVFSNFTDKARCDMPTGVSGSDSLPGNCTPSRLSGFEFLNWGTNGLRSIADHAELSWSQPNASITTELKGATATKSKTAPDQGLSSKGYDTLTFRIAVVRPMGQEVYVTLTDRVGKSATVTASNFSDALYNAPRKKAGGEVKLEDDLPMKDAEADKNYSSGQVKMLLNMVAIPLRAFEGIDTTSLKELKLVFPKASGKVALADIELQDFGRDKLACEVAMPKPDWCRTSTLVAGNTPQQTAQPENKDKLLLINQ